MVDWTSASQADLERMAEDAMANLDREKAKLAELSRLWDENTTVHAKDHSLAMTVDGRGELVDVTFTGTKYRTMPPAQLAHVIVETLRRARAEGMAKVSEAMGPPTDSDLDLAGIASGKVDPMAVVNALMAPMLDGLDSLGGTETPQRPATDRRNSDG